VKHLEILKETNSVQILELTQSLSRAHYQAETAKTEMQFRIYNLEAVVASQTQALETAQVCSVPSISNNASSERLRERQLIFQLYALITCDGRCMLLFVHAGRKCRAEAAIATKGSGSN
jgi:hypothetical protein